MVWQFNCRSYTWGDRSLRGAFTLGLWTKNMALLVSIYNFFFEIFFGCSHNSLTRPFTLQARSYKVCLDCGRQFPYSLEKMRVLHPWEVRKPQPIVLEPAFASAASEVREDYSPTKAIA